MDLREIQDRFDLEKCNDSRIAGKDTCGTYDFCVCCDKELEYPCANAKVKFANRQEKETVYYRLAVLRPIQQPENVETHEEEIAAEEEAEKEEATEEEIAAEEEAAPEEEEASEKEEPVVAE